MAESSIEVGSDGVYQVGMINRRVVLGMSQLGGDVKVALESAVAGEIEGKCIVDGFIRPQSVRLISYSSGLLSGPHAEFEVVVQCDVCCPTVGQIVGCRVQNVTKAGIRAELPSTPSPLMIFVARDHHHRDKDFSTVDIGQTIKVKVIGQRYELNDPYVSVIASLEPEPKQASKGLKRIPSSLHGESSVA